MYKTETNGGNKAKCKFESQWSRQTFCRPANHKYSALFTSLDLQAIEVWRLYRGRAVAENRIKELKYDFGMDAFNLSKFFPNEPAFRSKMVAYI